MHVAVSQQVFWIMILKFLHAWTAGRCEVYLTFNRGVRFFMLVVWEGKVHSTLQLWAHKERIYFSCCLADVAPVPPDFLFLSYFVSTGACWC